MLAAKPQLRNARLPTLELGNEKKKKNSDGTHFCE